MIARGKISAFFAVATALVVVGGMVAFACTNLATLDPSSTSGPGGSNVTLTGTSFAVATEGAAASPVSIRWSKLDGPVLAELTPDAQGAIAGSIVVPKADAGHYVLLATQLDEKGDPQFGTPARAPFEIVGPSGKATPPPGADAVSSSSDSGSAALVVALGAVALGVFALGFVAFVQERRRSTSPEAQRVPHS